MRPVAKIGWLLLFTLPSLVHAGPGYRPTLNEVQKLLPSDGGYHTRFGDSVAIDGDTAIIGASMHDGSAAVSGAAYVFTRNGGVWTEQQQLTASDGAFEDYFGWSVSISGDTALVGAMTDDDEGTSSGSAYVFARSAGVWTEQQKLTAFDGASLDLFGDWVAVDGDTAVIGARWDDDNGPESGSAYVYIRSAGVWSLQQKLVASDGESGDQFRSGDLDGDTVVVGTVADTDNGHESGAAYVFARTGGVWTEQQKLIASDGARGDQLGFTVAVSGDTAAVSAPFDDDNVAESGSIYIYIRVAGGWTEQQKLTASDGLYQHTFGASLSLEDDILIISAIGDDANGPHTGSAYVFNRAAGFWREKAKLLASDGAEFNFFGNYYEGVAISGDTILVGAYGNEELGYQSGAAYIFEVSGIPNVPPPIICILTCEPFGQFGCDNVVLRCYFISIIIVIIPVVIILWYWTYRRRQRP